MVLEGEERRDIRRVGSRNALLRALCRILTPWYGGLFCWSACLGGLATDTSCSLSLVLQSRGDERRVQVGMEGRVRVVNRQAPASSLGLGM